MSDASSSPERPVSMSKGAKNAGSAALAPRPPAAMYAAYAMAGAAVLGAIASVMLYFQDDFVYDNALKALKKTNDKAKAKDKQSLAELVHKAHQQVTAAHKNAITGAVLVLVALGFIGQGIWRGRHWARWGTFASWFVASFFIRASVGLGSVLGVVGDIPLAYKVPSFLAGVLMIVAVALTLFPSAVRWFALSKPTVGPGGRQRGGLFAPRQPRSAPAARTAPTATIEPANADAATRAQDGAAASSIAADRARAKKRATVTSAASVAKGADLARTRAKAASKSRRTEA